MKKTHTRGEYTVHKILQIELEHKNTLSQVTKIRLKYNIYTVPLIQSQNISKLAQTPTHPNSRAMPNRTIAPTSRNVQDKITRNILLSPKAHSLLLLK